MSSERAEDAIKKIVEAFESGKVAEPFAKVFIRKDQNLPMNTWSFTNQFICIISGCTDARGFRQWQEVNRYVLRGQVAMAYILFPLQKKMEQEDGEARYITYGFKGSPVFDISQTAGEELPDMVKEREFIQSLPLMDVARAFGLKVFTYQVQSQRDGEGYLLPSANMIGLGVENVSVFLHELMHAADKRLGNLKEKGQHWRSETVAELGAAALQVMLGQTADMGGAWGYIKHYVNEADTSVRNACLDVLKRTAEAVQLIIDTAESLPAVEAEEVESVA